MPITEYTVTIDTPKGEAKVDLHASSPAFAGKRVLVTALQQRWADDLSDLSIVDITPTAELEDK